MATLYTHTLKITDLQTLAEYPWELQLPFPLALTADQVTGIMQTIAAALPVTAYGFKVSAAVQATTTTTNVSSTPFPDVTVPGQPPPPAAP